MTRRPNKVVALTMTALVLLMAGCAQQALQPNSPPDSDYYKGYMDGLQAAEQHSGEMPWGCGAYGGTLACCLIGLGVASLAGSSSAAPPPEMLLGKSPEYMDGLRTAFQARARQKRQSAAYMGTGLGMATNAIVNVILLTSGVYGTQ